ncbi:MAG TPA: hypothetical protein VFB80_02910, partial [Pirellulaceae bacterium]|nr:hypothetical protein [Pirellulaceae bacterium]
MKASVPLLTGCVALGLTLPATLCQAAHPAAGALTITAASFGQLGFGGARSGSASGDVRRKSEDLLNQARKAIKQGDFVAAESFIAEAEKLDAKYDVLTERFVDTPAKIRKLLAEERVKAGASGRLPAQPAAAPIPGDPYALRQVANPQAPNLLSPESAAERLLDDGKSKAQSHLKDARAALAAGDKFAALAAWQRAAAIPATYAPGEDSPQTVAQELARAGVDTSRLKPPMPPAPYALRPSDVESQSDRVPPFSANPNAIPAAAVSGNLSPYNLPPETNPLAASPASPAGGGQFQPPDQSAPQAPGQFTPIGGYPEPQRLNPGAAQRLPVGDSGAKSQAASLVAQARLALDKGDLRAAQQFADQAEALNIPDTAFEAGETRPWQISLEISRAMYRREGVQPASATGPAAVEPKYPVAQGMYNPATDTTKIIPANSQGSVLARTQATGEASSGARLYQ